MNVSILAAAHAAQSIPLSCVEQGRWRHIADKFTGSRNFSFTNLRRQKAARVAESLCTRCDFSADQSAIWDEVARKQQAMGVHSATGAVNEVYERHMPKMEEFSPAFSVFEGQVGNMVFLKEWSIINILLSRKTIVITLCRSVYFFPGVEIVYLGRNAIVEFL